MGLAVEQEGWCMSTPPSEQGRKTLLGKQGGSSQGCHHLVGSGNRGQPFCRDLTHELKSTQHGGLEKDCEAADAEEGWKAEKLLSPTILSISFPSFPFFVSYYTVSISPTL